MMSRKLEDYLRLCGVRYVEVPHPDVATEGEIVEARHRSTRGLAKVVAVQAEKGEWLLAVLPAPRLVDLEALARVSGKKGLRLASEKATAQRFGPDPPTPFVDLCGVPVYIDHGFADWSHIYFEDRDHGAVGIRVRDYVRVTRPLVGRFTHPA
jgi:Ala-tRNA(Pro) deacylase